jgi:outer membrane receptor protein involved in Fe transport
MYTGVLSDRTVVEARVAGFWGDDHSDPIVSGEQRTQPRFYDLDTGEVTGGIYYWYDDKSYQATASLKVSHFADDFLGSSHDFKFGVQYVNGGVHDAVSGPNDLVYTYTYTDYYYGTSTKYAYGYDYQPYAYGGTTSGVGVFFDDTVRVGDRLTLNLGVRFDSNTAKVPTRDVLDQLGNSTGQTLAAQDLFTWNVFSPRVGFNFKLTKDGKTSLQGHYGRYYRGIVTAEYSNSVAASYVVRAGSYDLENQAWLDPEVVKTSPGSQSVDPNYKNPYTDQFVASLQREIVRDLGLSVHYIYKRSRMGPAWRDTTGVYEPVTILDEVGPGATGKPVTVYRRLSDSADSVYVLSNDPRVKTDVHALTGQVVKRMSHGWQLVTSYTYQDSKGVLPSGRLGLLDSQRAAARFTTWGQSPNDFVNAYGKLLADRPHTFKTQLVVELPHGFLLGANYLFQSGRAWARRARVSEPDLGFPTAPEVNIEERDGERRVPNQSLFDVRLQKSFALGEKLRFSVFGDALNLFNSGTNQGVLSRTVDTSGDSPDTFGVASDFVLPRRFMLGAKVTF